MSRKSDTKNNYVPTDYDDLYRYYIQGERSLCSSLVRTMMPYATPDELETLPEDVFLRIQEKDMIKVFDPSKANFGGVIFFVTRTIVGNYLAKKSRNPLTGLCGGSLSSTEPEDGLFEPGAYSLTRLFGAPTPRYEAQLDARRILSELFDWAKALHDAPRHKRDQSLYPLLEMVAEETDPKEAAVRLGVTPSTISNWLVHIKDKARELQAQIEGTATA